MDNLKSLNLSHNKLTKCHLITFALNVSASSLTTSDSTVSSAYGAIDSTSSSSSSSSGNKWLRSVASQPFDALSPPHRLSHNSIGHDSSSTTTSSTTTATPTSHMNGWLHDVGDQLDSESEEEDTSDDSDCQETADQLAAVTPTTTAAAAANSDEYYKGVRIRVASTASANVLINNNKKGEHHGTDSEMLASSASSSSASSSSFVGMHQQHTRLKEKLSPFSSLKKRLGGGGGGGDTESPHHHQQQQQHLLHTPPKLSSQSSGVSSSSSLSSTKKKHAATVTPQTAATPRLAMLLYPNLTHLDVSGNKLRRLSGRLAVLEHLSYLNASSNALLTRVSPRLGLLSKLWNLDMRNCAQLREPNTIEALVKQRTKTSDILGFLKSILEHSRPYARIKLMLVGVQAIGKTSLLNRLREEGLSVASYSQAENKTKQPNISTVGIDINEWTYERASGARNARTPLSTSTSVSSSISSADSATASSTSLQQQQQQQQTQSLYVYQMDEALVSRSTFHGPITYRTWDFAGQREYYTTHQYFISKRALYLVCWKLSEEEKGIGELANWLSNIQTRAAGSPVIIVGTHHDQLAKLKNYKEISSYLQRLIYERFVRSTVDTETTSAYPPIMASIEIRLATMRMHNYKVDNDLLLYIYCATAQRPATTYARSPSSSTTARCR